MPDPTFKFENAIGLFREDPVTGYSNRPGFSGYAQGRIRVSTNRFGLRGAEIAEAKPAGAIRVLGLGDSVTWGVGVQQERTFLAVLEKKTAEARLEVLNAGVVGYSLHQELLALEHYGLKLRPDIVLAGFVVNDVYPTEDPYFNVSRFHRPSRDNLRRRNYEASGVPRSYLFAFTRATIRMAKWGRQSTQDSGSKITASNPTPWDIRADDWPVMQQHFRDMHSLSEVNGSRLLILLFPTVDQLRAGGVEAGSQETVAAFLRGEGIEYLDLAEPLKSRAVESFMDRMHLTALGHEITAEAIRSRLSSLGWLSARRE